ncbi:PP0621 family protein [Pseudomonas luteola]|uniref:PP0621 family protein n=1 Tax=Pseudomonas luteola TaxID=47886 RepID=UPI001FD57385|nr:PP0621 family protein [Pseudomonas zeshuii]
MGLFRLLFWLALIIAIVWLCRRLLQAKPQKSQKTRLAKPQPMVRCGHCGVHIPRDKALPHGEHWFCRQDHLQKSLSSER